MEATLAKPVYFTRLLAQATGNVSEKHRAILGAELANIASSWRPLGDHVRSSWALGRPLGPSWLHFGYPFARYFVSRVLLPLSGTIFNDIFHVKTDVFNVTGCLWLPKRAYALMCFLSAYLSQRASRSLTKTGLC